MFAQDKKNLSPLIIQPSSGVLGAISDFFSRLVGRSLSRDVVGFSQGAHVLIEKSRLLNAPGNDDETKAALKVLEIALLAVHEERKTCHRPMNKKEMCHAENLLATDVYSLASILAAKSGQHVLELLFQGGLRSKIIAVRKVMQSPALTQGRLDLFEKMRGYATSSIVSVKKLIKYLDEAPEGFIKLMDVSEELRKKTFETLLEKKSDALAAYFVESACVGIDYAIKCLFDRDPCDVPLTSKIIFEKRPKALNALPKERFNAIVRGAYKKAVELLPWLAYYVDVRPVSEQERAVFRKNAKIFDWALEKRPIFLKTPQFSQALCQCVGAEVVQNCHPVQVAYFLPELFPRLLADIGLGECLSLGCSFSKFNKVFSSGVFNFMLSFVRVTDDHYRVGCPPSLLPKHKPSATIEDLPPLTENITNSDLRNKIAAGVHTFLQCVRLKQARLGVPANPEARKAFYAQISQWLSFTAAQLKKSQDPRTITCSLGEIANAASACGGRHFRIAEKVYQNVCHPESRGTVERFSRHLGDLRRLCLEDACAIVIGDVDHNIHGVTHALIAFGERLGIPGYKDETFKDIYNVAGYNSYAILNEFHKLYSPSAIIDHLVDILRTDEEMRSIYYDLWNLFIPAEWEASRYEQYFVTAGAIRKKTAAETISEALKGVPPVSNAPNVSQTLSNDAVHAIETRPAGSPEGHILLAKWLENKKRDQIEAILGRYNIVEKGSVISVEAPALANEIFQKSSEDVGKILEKYDVFKIAGLRPETAKNVCVKLFADRCTINNLEQIQDVLYRYVFKTRPRYCEASILAKRCEGLSSLRIASILNAFEFLLKNEQSNLFAVEEARMYEFQEELRQGDVFDKYMVALLLEKIGIFGLTGKELVMWSHSPRRSFLQKIFSCFAHQDPVEDDYVTVE
jgi:hypothetical protein